MSKYPEVPKNLITPMTRILNGQINHLKHLKGLTLVKFLRPKLR